MTCELGERLMNEYEDIEYVISQLNWYLLPAKIQKTLPIIINNAQQAVDVQCFGSMNICRESFQKVNKFLWFDHIMLNLFFSTKIYFR